MKTSKIATRILFGCAAFLMTSNLKAAPVVNKAVPVATVNIIANIKKYPDLKSLNFQIFDTTNKIVCESQGIQLSGKVPLVSCPLLNKAKGGTFKLIVSIVSSTTTTTTTTNCAPSPNGIPFQYEPGDQGIEILVESNTQCKVFSN